MKIVMHAVACSCMSMSLVILPNPVLAQQSPNKNHSAPVVQQGPVNDPLYEARLQEAFQEEKKGFELLKAGKNDEAVKAFQEVLSVYVSDNAYAGIAEAYTAKGQYVNALNAYRTLIYPFPGKDWSSSHANDMITLMKFAILLNITGQRVEAIDVYAKGLANLNTKSDPAPTTYFTTPNYNAAQFEAAARTAIGIKEYRSGHDDEALVELQKAVKVQPRFALAYFYLGRVLSDKKQVADSHAAFEKAATLGKGEVKTLAEKELKR